MPPKTDDKPRARDLVVNRRARHEYEFVEKFEAGIALRGSEVKSLREGKASIVEAYITPQGTELYITGMHITPYENCGNYRPEPTRERKLLLHRKEINRLLGAVAAKGMTIVPLKLYLNERGLVKCSLALARGKALHDKREDIKRRTMDRELAREYKVR